MYLLSLLKYNQIKLSLHLQNSKQLWSSCVVNAVIEHNIQTVTQNEGEWTTVLLLSSWSERMCVHVKSVVADNYGVIQFRANWTDSEQLWLWGRNSFSVWSCRYSWPYNVCHMERVQTDDGMGGWNPFSFPEAWAVDVLQGLGAVSQWSVHWRRPVEELFYQYRSQAAVGADQLSLASAGKTTVAVLSGQCSGVRGAWGPLRCECPETWSWTFTLSPLMKSGVHSSFRDLLK